MDQSNFNDLADRIIARTTLVCAVIGAVLGIVPGFSFGRVGGAILGFIVGAVIGGVVSGPIGYLLVLLHDTELVGFIFKLVGVVCAVIAIGWLITRLWGVGL